MLIIGMLWRMGWGVMVEVTPDNRPDIWGLTHGSGIGH
jgi:hypothetical protein